MALPNKINIQIENVWQDKSEELIEEIIQYWYRTNVLPADKDLKGRANQVVLTAREPGGQIVGVTTAFPMLYPALKNTFFYFRGSMDSKFRIPGLFTKMTRDTLEYLETIHKNYQPTPIGAIAEIENANLQKMRNVVTPAGLIFIGYNQAGAPVRVYYFKGAKY